MEKDTQAGLEVTEEEAVHEHMEEFDNELQTEAAALQREQLAESAVERLIREKVIEVS